MTRNSKPTILYVRCEVDQDNGAVPLVVCHGQQTAEECLEPLTSFLSSQLLRRWAWPLSKAKVAACIGAFRKHKVPLAGKCHGRLLQRSSGNRKLRSIQPHIVIHVLIQTYQAARGPSPDLSQKTTSNYIVEQVEVTTT